MRNRLRAALALALAAGLCAAAEAVWVVAFLDHASDGPAFAMALVATVLVPTLLVAMCGVLVPAAPRATWFAATGAVTASGLVAAGVEAGVFVGDDPTDPAFIHWVAAMPAFALIAAVLLVGVAGWGVLRLPMAVRILVTVVSSGVTPIVLGFGLLTAMPLVMLWALAAPVVLTAVAIAITLRQRRPAVI